MFIGGGVDAELLELCFAALKPGGRLVANAVTIEGEASLIAFHQAQGGELTRFSVARAEPLGGHHAWRAAGAGDPARLPQGSGPAVSDGILLGERLDYLAEGRRPWILLLLLSLALFLPGLTALPPVDRDEARYIQATRQMLETGDLVQIRFQDEARNKKPVGIYWLQSALVGRRCRAPRRLRSGPIGWPRCWAPPRQCC